MNNRKTFLSVTLLVLATTSLASPHSQEICPASPDQLNPTQGYFSPWKSSEGPIEILIQKGWIPHFVAAEIRRLEKEVCCYYALQLSWGYSKPIAMLCQWAHQDWQHLGNHWKNDWCLSNFSENCSFIDQEKDFNPDIS